MDNITVGSGNIFADLGLSDPEERLAKADVAIRIEALIQQRGLTQAEAARQMRLTQPQVSHLVRGQLKGFTLDRLFQCLNALDQDVEIVIRPKQNVTANTYVSPSARISAASAAVPDKSISEK